MPLPDDERKCRFLKGSVDDRLIKSFDVLARKIHNLESMLENYLEHETYKKIDADKEKQYQKYFEEGSGSKNYKSHIEKVKGLRNEVDNKLKGLIGESHVAYNLDAFNLYGENIPMYVLWDVAIIDSAEKYHQIDFIVITGNHIYIIECKNWSYDVLVKEMS